MITAKVENKIIAKEQSYPFIGINDSNNLTVLFIRKGVGIVLSSGSNTIWAVGEYADAWPMPNFRPLQGEEQIVMKNQ